MLRSRLLMAGGPPLVPECPNSGEATATDTIYNILTSLGLISNLQACFDAGDAACYNGSGSVVTNRAAGGVNLNLTGATAFVGTAGAKDGTDYFTVPSSTEYLQYTSMPAWANLSTKAQSFTVATWFLPRGPSYLQLLSSIVSGSSCNSWFEFYTSSDASNYLTLNFDGCYGACGSAWNFGINSQGMSGASWDCWHFAALSVAEGVTNGTFLYLDGAYVPIIKQAVPGSSTINTITATNTVTLTYNTSAGYGQAPYANGRSDAYGVTRQGAMLHWQNAAATGGGNLSKAQLDQLYNATKSRYGW